MTIGTNERSVLPVEEWGPATRTCEKRSKSLQLHLLQPSKRRRLLDSVCDVWELEEFDLPIDLERQSVGSVDQRPDWDHIVEGNDARPGKGGLDVHTTDGIQRETVSASEKYAADLDVRIQDRDPASKIDDASSLQVVLDRGVDAPDPAKIEHLLAEPEIAHDAQL